MRVAWSGKKSLWSYNPIPNGCILYLPFWSPGLAGAAFQSADPYRQSITVTGAVHGGQGRVMDGDDYVLVPGGNFFDTIPANGEIEMWVKLNSTFDSGAALNMNLITKANDGVGNELFRWFLAVADGKLYMDFCIAGVRTRLISTKASWAAGWWLFGCSWGSGGQKQYYNTTNDGSDVNTSVPGAGATKDFMIGAYNFGATIEYLTGTVGEVTIWNRLLSAGERTYYYERTKGLYL